MIKIFSNGSKWAGEAPDNIEKLKERLKTHPLDPTFEKYGNFAFKGRKGKYFLFGNFRDISAVFNIETDNQKVFLEMKKLIRENQRRPDYIKAKEAIK